MDILNKYFYDFKGNYSIFIRRINRFKKQLPDNLHSNYDYIFSLLKENNNHILTKKILNILYNEAELNFIFTVKFNIGELENSFKTN